MDHTGPTGVLVHRSLRRVRADIKPSCTGSYASPRSSEAADSLWHHRNSRITHPCPDGMSHLHRPNPPPHTSSPCGRALSSSIQRGRASRTWAHSRTFQTDTASSGGSSDRWSFPQASGSPRCRSCTCVNTFLHPTADVLACDRPQGQPEPRAMAARQFAPQLRV